MLPNTQTIINAAEPCVTVEQFAAHAYIDNLSDTDSELIAAYIAAAEDAVSREIKRPLGVCTVQFAWPGAAAKQLDLSFTPLVQVIDVTVDGESTGFVVDETGVFPQIRVQRDVAPDASIVATAQVGYVQVPQALRVAVMMLAAGMYEHRTDQAEQSLTNVKAFERLLSAYKQEFAY